MHWCYSPILVTPLCLNMRFFPCFRKHTEDKDKGHHAWKLLSNTSDTMKSRRPYMGLHPTLLIIFLEVWNYTKISLKRTHLCMCVRMCVHVRTHVQHCGWTQSLTNANLKRIFFAHECLYCNRRKWVRVNKEFLLTLYPSVVF